MVELQKLYQISAGTLAMRSSTRNSETTPAKPPSKRAKGKMATAIQRAISVLPTTASTMEAFTSLPLDNYEVLVLNGSDAFSKAELEQRLVTLGAKIVQSPPQGSTTENFIAFAGKDCGIRVKNFKLLKNFDLIDAEIWLDACNKLHRLPPLNAK